MASQRLLQSKRKSPAHDVRSPPILRVLPRSDTGQRFLRLKLGRGVLSGRDWRWRFGLFPFCVNRALSRGVFLSHWWISIGGLASRQKTEPALLWCTCFALQSRPLSCRTFCFNQSMNLNHSLLRNLLHFSFIVTLFLLYKNFLIGFYISFSIVLLSNWIL